MKIKRIRERIHAPIPNPPSPADLEGLSLLEMALLVEKRMGEPLTAELLDEEDPNSPVVLHDGDKQAPSVVMSQQAFNTFRGNS